MRRADRGRRPRGLPCFAGLDLGQRDDFSALALVFLLPDGRMAVRMRYWVPEAILTTAPHRRPYAHWRSLGLLAITQGTRIDDDQVEAEVIELCQRWAVRSSPMTPSSPSRCRSISRGRGSRPSRCRRATSSMRPSGRSRALVSRRQLAHGGDPVLAWMVSNVALRRGMRGEVRLDKEHAAEKIDGVAALAMALARAIVTPGGSVYDGRGVLVL